MITLFLPFLIGIAIGLSPAAPPEETASLPETSTAAAADPVPAAAAVRTPEPQIPTGQFTTAVEIRSILGMTKQSWVAVRLYEGQDLLYFTHLLAWRCGLWDVRYGVNGAPATEVVPLEPCHDGTAQPNALTDVAGFPPYVTLPAASVESVYVELLYDDGSTDFAVFQRQAVLIP